MDKRGIVAGCSYIIGYPGEPYVGTYVPTLLEELFRSTFGFKRLAPGSVVGSNYQVADWTVTHDCTTLGGSSGSASSRAVPVNDGTGCPGRP